MTPWIHHGYQKARSIHHRYRTSMFICLPAVVHQHSTPQKNLPEKLGGWKTCFLVGCSFLLGRYYWVCYVSLRELNSYRVMEEMFFSGPKANPTIEWFKTSLISTLTFNITVVQSNMVVDLPLSLGKVTLNVSYSSRFATNPTTKNRPTNVVISLVSTPHPGFQSPPGFLHF